MRRVLGLVPIHTTERGDLKWQLAVFKQRTVLQHARLHRRCVRAKHVTRLCVEGVLHITSWVVLRNVQRIEAVVIGLNLWAHHVLESERT